MGYDASQGSSNSRSDGISAFNFPPYLNGELVLEKEAQLLELYKDIPFSQFKKDSIKSLLDISKLELAESYILKYKNYNLGENIITRFLSNDSNSKRATKAKYLLYKSYKVQGNSKYIEIKDDIIKNDSLSRFAKILFMTTTSFFFPA